MQEPGGGVLGADGRNGLDERWVEDFPAAGLDRPQGSLDLIPALPDGTEFRISPYCWAVNDAGVMPPPSDSNAASCVWNVLTV